MKKKYVSPLSETILLEYTHHLLDVSKEMEPVPSGEGTPDAPRYHRFDEEDEEDEEDW